MKLFGTPHILEQGENFVVVCHHFTDREDTILTWLESQLLIRANYLKLHYEFFRICHKNPDHRHSYFYELKTNPLHIGRSLSDTHTHPS